MKKSKAAEVPKPRETVTLSEDRINQFRETFAGKIWPISYGPYDMDLEGLTMFHPVTSYLLIHFLFEQALLQIDKKT